MAAYPPPTEDLPIFDDSVFTAINNTPLTLSSASKYFLRYPNAQGDENLQSIDVAGLSTFYGNIVMDGVGNYLQFPDGTQQTTASSSTGYALLDGGTSTTPQNFTGYNEFSNTTYFDSFLNLANGVYLSSLASLPTTPISSPYNTGCVLGWNWSSGGGETDFLSYGQGAGDVGGFKFYATNSSTAPILMASFSGQGNNLYLPTNAPTPTTGDNSQQIATTAFVQNSIGGLSANPTGTILMYGGSGTTPPTGYLWCNTTAYSTTGTYANLYSVIGTYYNSPSTPAGYFNVPQFHTGTQGTAIFPVAGGCYSTSQGVLGVTQANGTGNTQSPVICGGNSTITLTQIPDHIHQANNPSSNYISSLSGGSLLTTGGSQSYVKSGTGTPFSNNTGTMEDTAGNPVYSSTQGQGQFYPPFCSVQFIIKY